MPGNWRVISGRRTAERGPQHVLRLLADEHMSAHVLSALPKQWFRVTRLPRAGLPDGAVRQYAKQNSLVVLTRDRAFYDDDGIHPIQETSGVIALGGAPSGDLDRLLFWYPRFFSALSRSDWYRTKVLLSGDHLVIKQVCRYTGIHEQEFALLKGLPMRRDLRGSHPNAG